MVLTMTAKPASLPQLKLIRDLVVDKPDWMNNVPSLVVDTIMDVLGNVGNPDPKFVEIKEASAAISALLAYKPAKTLKSGANVNASPFTRLQAIVSLLKPGYYALPRQDGTETYDFFRIVEVESGNWKGHRFVNRLLGSPGGWTRVKPSMTQQLQLAKAIARDWEAAAKAYAEFHKKCARCNADLSNPRSQVALVGEHCAGEWGWTW